MKTTFSLTLASVLVCLLLGACASSNEQTRRPDTDANGERVSSIPWNKPQSWEGTGQLGGLGGR